MWQIKVLKLSCRRARSVQIFQTQVRSVLGLLAQVEKLQETAAYKHGPLDFRLYSSFQETCIPCSHTLTNSFNCRIFNLLNSFGLYNKNAKILFLVRH